MEEIPIIYRNVGLTTDDAVKFLNSFGPAGSCPVCKANDWSINFTPGEGQHVELRTVPPAGAKAYGIGVFFVICDTCGYVRTHTLSALVDWKKDVGAK